MVAQSFIYIDSIKAFVKGMGCTDNLNGRIKTSAQGTIVIYQHSLQFFIAVSFSSARATIPLAKLQRC
jgi:hypothetical protein